MTSAESKRRLVDVDETAVVAGYEAYVTTGTTCHTHQIPLTRLYRILDAHQVSRRRPNAPKLPKKLRERILSDYTRGDDVAAIARRRGVAASTVSQVAQRHGVSRIPKYTREQLVDLVVRHLAGDDVDHEQRSAPRSHGSVAVPRCPAWGLSNTSIQQSPTTSPGGLIDVLNRRGG